MTSRVATRALTRNRDLNRLAMLVFACSLTCCYDSRWGAAERSQKVVVQHATPSELHGSADPEAPEAPLRDGRVRAYVTPSYAALVSDERTQIERLLDDANQVVEPSLGLHLVLSDVRRWPSADEGDLGAALVELETIDKGDDVDWVVGFIGRLPILEQSFTQLGRARMHGRHLVTRAMNDAVEYDWIERSLDEIDEAARATLYRKRVEHKETAVFLHELAHTLGVPHMVDDVALMNGRYNHATDGYSDEAVDMMRLSTNRRLDPASMTEQQLARTLTKLVQDTSAIWVADEREEWLAHMTPLAVEAPAAMERPEGFDPGRWASLDEAERASLRVALQHERDGDPQGAWSYAEALFGAHPNAYEIQELRCRLAMRIGGPVDEMESHCASFNRLEEAARRSSP